MQNDSRESNKDNSYIFDTEAATELSRLLSLDRLITKGMGGPLAEHPDPSSLEKVLDLACGPGGWVLDVAYAYPEVEVAGIDISKTMISYASARARSQGLHNASFEVMNITQPLEFSDNTFDLVNARFLVAALPRTAWPQLLQECFRITRKGGIIRLTETDGLGPTTSPAYETLAVKAAEVMQSMGYGFSTDKRGHSITHMLDSFLRKAGCKDIQSKAHTVNYSAGTNAFYDIYRNSEIVIQFAIPLYVKTGLLTEEEATQLYQQMRIEMLSDDFCAIWYYLTTYGVKP